MQIVKWIKRLALFSTVFVLLSALTLIISIERLSGGYIKLRLDGVYTSERLLTNDGTNVLLIGVAHIADRRFYDEVYESVTKSESLVLAEGVTDKLNLVPKKFSYNTFANKLALTDQSYLYERLKAYGKIEGADIDVSDFDEQTLTFIRTLGPVMEGTASPALEKAFRESIQAPIVIEQILHFRSQRLLAYFDKKHVNTEQIAIPWGAAHMREIEEGFLARGFRMSNSKNLRLTSYAPVLELIFRPKFR